MAKKKEISVEDKLRALYDLQLIDSRIDEIKNLRGELPLEVEDLENEGVGKLFGPGTPVQQTVDFITQWVNTNRR